MFHCLHLCLVIISISKFVFVNVSSLSVQQSAEREQLARSMERELEGLRHEVEQLHRAREAALRDNVRLQDDLDAVTHDLRMQQQELAQAKSESDAIKRQLKDYVTEVRRVEDTLSQKVLFHFMLYFEGGGTIQKNCVDHLSKEKI